ncbi:MAG TPA: asparaginase [Gemmatimonadaceae bacterium]|nr:asparaginase [Gemmatimonadaceae bacterium]
MQPLPLDVVVMRGATIESRHRVHAAVVGPLDALVAGARDHGMVTMWRSCAKFFQVLPFLACGGFDKLGWGDEELALACASHGGEPEHLALARKMLESIGLEEGDLACGPHEPLSPRGVRCARESGRAYSRLHNNCSGKHAAMLARAHSAGWPTQGYERAGHSVQRGCLAEVAKWSDVPIDDMPIGVDGCGATVMALPLDRMALAFSRWGRSVAQGEELPFRTASAVRRHPHLLAGTERFDTVLLEETAGEVIAKVGAEGVHSVAVPGVGLGIAVKVEDGALRAQHVAVVRLLQQLGVLPATLSARLQEWAVKTVRNTRGEIVGEVRSEA